MSAKIIIFQFDFFGCLVPKVLISSFVTVDTCLARFIIETGVWLSYEGDRGKCMQFMVNDDSEFNEEEFSGICS